MSQYELRDSQEYLAPDELYSNKKVECLKSSTVEGNSSSAFSTCPGKTPKLSVAHFDFAESLSEDEEDQKNKFEHLFLTPTYTTLRKRPSSFTQSDSTDARSKSGSLSRLSQPRSFSSESVVPAKSGSCNIFFEKFRFWLKGNLLSLSISKRFRVSLRGILGYFLLSIFVFVPCLYNDIFGPLAIEMFLLTVTFGYEELAFGFVSLGALQSTAALIFAASFGALGAYASNESYIITFFIAALGSLLFTLLHSDSRMSLISSMGELYFVFNLLDSHSRNDERIVIYFFDTLIGAGLTHVVSLLVAGLLFPSSATQEMKECIGSSLIGAGASLSKCASLLLTPKIEDRLDPFDGKCLLNPSYSPAFIKHILCDDLSLGSRIMLHRASKLKQYIIFEPNIVRPLHQEPVRQWEVVIESVEGFLKTIQSLQSALDGERRHFKGDLLTSGNDLKEVLVEHFSFIAAYCKIFGEYIKDMGKVSVKKSRDDFIAMIVEFSEWETYEGQLRERLRFAYEKLWLSSDFPEARKTAVELGPIMSIVIFAKSLLDGVLDIQESMIQLELAKEQKSLLRMMKNLFSWLQVLLWPLQHWFLIVRNIPRSKQELLSTCTSNEFQFCCKKWTGALVLLVVLLLTPARQFALKYDGTWLWMAYVLYIQPSVEGTLLGGVMCLTGVSVGCTIGLLLMNWPTTAMNPYLLNIYLGLVTGVSVYFANSSLSITFITFAFTEYVIIFYQYSPFEYAAHWYYAVVRFILIFIGISVAVILNEFVLPHSALTDVRESLAASLRKLSAGQSWMLQKFYSSRMSDISNVSSFSLEGRISVNSVHHRSAHRKQEVFHRESSEASTQSESSDESDCSSEVPQKQHCRKSKASNFYTIEQSLLDIRSLLQSLENGIGARLHTVPKVLCTALEQEQKLLNRLTAFEIVMKYDPFITGSFQYILHKQFVEPLEQATKNLVRSKKALIDVAVSCILDGKVFKSLQFLREFGFSSARRTARVAWYSADVTKRTLKKAVHSFRDRSDKKRRPRKKQNTFKEATQTHCLANEMKLSSNDFCVNNNSHSDISGPSKQELKRQARSHECHDTVQPGEAANFAYEVCDITMGDKELENSRTAVAISSDLETSLPDKRGQNIFTYFKRLFDKFQRRLNTGSTKFGSVGSTMLDYVVHEIQSGNESAVPPIIKNLQDAIEALKEAQKDYYLQYHTLEEEYHHYKREGMRTSFLTNGDKVTFKNVQQQEETDIRVMTPDDTVIFFAAFFSSAYVFDGFKHLARALIEAVRSDLDRIRESYQFLIKNELRKAKAGKAKRSKKPWLRAKDRNRNRRRSIQEDTSSSEPEMIASTYSSATSSRENSIDSISIISSAPTDISDY
eukprot:jgi/Galph1/320/GphlegSOOS_G5028.1